MRIPSAILALACIAAGTLSAQELSAQEPVRLIEVFSPGYQYRVSCRVALEGNLRLPAGKEKDPSARDLKIAGKSVIDYHERVLSVAQGRVERTVRKVHQMDFARNVGGQDQESKLRPDVSLLVLQRLQNLEVPFSPRGPLLWNEIDLVRTDVFTPALAGLLPRGPVRPGDAWPADVDAVKELTDLETIKKGGLTCRYDGPETANPRLARVSVTGVMNGVGEDGPAEHQLDGYFFFDLKANHLSYLSLQGIHRPMNADGVPQGELKGTFVLTRDVDAKLGDLTDEALRRWELTPGDDNTQLLFDSADVRLLYPRHWRIEELGNRQVRLVEKQGSDLLITLDAPAKLPTTVQLQKEALNGLLKQKAQLTRLTNPRSLQAGSGTIEHFSAEATFAAQPAAFDYYVVRQRSGGATVSLRTTPAQAEQRRREAERIARSMVVSVR